MVRHNADNERIKRKYFAYLREAQRYGNASVDAAAKALNRFETTTRHRDFRQFHREQAVAFKRSLADQTNARTGERLSKSTLHSTLQAPSQVLPLACRPAWLPVATDLFGC